MLAPPLIPLALIRSGARWVFAVAPPLIPLALIRSGARWVFAVAPPLIPLALIRSGARGGSFRRGQAMIETVLAVLFVTFIFLVLFQLSHLVTGKILLDHAAARAARARAVGFNEFMCLKSARVAMIPVAGERTWPSEKLTREMEAARVPIYMQTDHEALARGILEYERWTDMKLEVDSDGGTSPKVESSVEISMPRFFRWGAHPDKGVRVKGESEIESHFPFYMEDFGR